jgi:two-component system sensor histidine kinase KdpD
MKIPKLTFTIDMFVECVEATFIVLATTALMFYIGRATLGEGVIALVYLVPISWSTTRWGQGPGACAAVIAFLCFNFFFIPPFFTFVVGSLEGWLLLIIFLSVALVVIGRIQYGLAQAQAREREAIFMYELSAALATARNPEVAARTLARHLQQLYQARLVRVILQPDDHAVTIDVPATVSETRQPDLIVPLLAARSLIGEVCLWRGHSPLPHAENRLIQNFAIQTANVLERLALSESASHA